MESRPAEGLEIAELRPADGPEGGGGGVGGGVGVGDDRLVLLGDGSHYDLDRLDDDALLNNLKEWDYPIFDLLDRYADHILSTVGGVLRCSLVFVASFLFRLPSTRNSAARE